MSWLNINLTIEKAGEFDPYVATLDVVEYPGRSGEGDIVDGAAFVLQTQHMDTTAHRSEVVKHALRSVAARWAFEQSVKKLPRTPADYKATQLW